VSLAAIAPTKGIGTWTCDGAILADPSSPTSTLFGIAVNQTVTCTWAVTNVLCPVSKDIVLITRYPQVTEPNIYFADSLVNNDILNICLGDKGPLRGELPKTATKEFGTWKTVSGNSILGVQGNVADFGTITATSIGSTQISWTIQNGVQGCSAKTNVFTVQVHGPSQARILPIPDTCALADTVMIYTDPLKTGEVGTWSGDKKPLPLAKDQWFIGGHDVEVGSTSFTWTVDNFICLPSSDTKSLNVNPATIPLIDLVDLDTVCQNTNIVTSTSTQNPGAGAKYVWEFNGVNIDTTLTKAFSMNNVSTSGKLKVTMLITDVCTYPNNISDSTELVVINKPRPYIKTPNVLVCEDSLVNLLAGDYTNNKNIVTTYNWLRGNTNLNLSDSIINNVNNGGVYVFTAQNKFCPLVSSNSIVVDLRKIPTVDASYNGIDPIIVSAGDIGELSGATSGESAMWSSLTLPGAIDDSLNLTSSLVAPDIEGKHTIRLKAINGPCSASDTVTLIVTEDCDCECNIQAPNVFTINGDGINETFKIKGIEECPKALVTIYNRWGAAIYKTTEYHLHEWDGKNYPEGVYFFVVKFSKKQKRGEGHTGTIHLLR
jgi:gliding motility-associated-like protein